MTNPNHPNVDQSDRVVPINLRQSGRTPTELLLSTRVRKSPFWHLSHEAGCWRATVYNRIYHPRGYVKPEDGGAMVEYEALVNRVTMWNVAVERQIRVKAQMQRLLQILSLQEMLQKLNLEMENMQFYVMKRVGC